MATNKEPGPTLRESYSMLLTSTDGPVRRTSPTPRKTSSMCIGTSLILDQRVKRTTISVPVGTIVPAAGACSRAMPVPRTWTPKPTAPACSITLRTGCPTSDGTATFLPAFTITEPLTMGAVGELTGIGGVGAGVSGGLGIIVSANTVVGEAG